MYPFNKKRIFRAKPYVFKAFNPKLVLLLLLIFFWDLNLYGIDGKSTSHSNQHHHMLGHSKLQFNNLNHHHNQLTNPIKDHHHQHHQNPQNEEKIQFKRLSLTQLLENPDQMTMTSNQKNTIDEIMSLISSNDQDGDKSDKNYSEMSQQIQDDPGTTLGGPENFVGPFIGNLDLISNSRKKKNCGLPTVAQRGTLGLMMKKSIDSSYFAIDENEMKDKKSLELEQEKVVAKRSVAGTGTTGTTGTGTTTGNEITADGPLPWACETKYEWKDMGVDHYPRFVRTAECKSKLCFNGFFRCRPRRYKTKVLKRVTGVGNEAASCEVENNVLQEDDVSLPDGLRNHWRFITVTINLCCDCTGRIPLSDK